MAESLDVAVASLAGAEANLEDASSRILLDISTRLVFVNDRDARGQRIGLSLRYAGVGSGEEGDSFRGRLVAHLSLVSQNVRSITSGALRVVT